METNFIILSVFIYSFLSGVIASAITQKYPEKQHTAFLLGLFLGAIGVLIVANGNRLAKNLMKN